MPDFRALKLNPGWEPVAASTEESLHRPRLGKMLGTPLMARVKVQPCKTAFLQVLWEFRVSEKSEADLLVVMTQWLGKEAKDAGDALDFLWAFGYRGRKETLAMPSPNLFEELGWDSCLVLEPEDRCLESFQGDLWEVYFTADEENEEMLRGVPLPLRDLATMRDFTPEAFQTMRQHFDAEIRSEVRSVGVEKADIWIN